MDASIVETLKKLKKSGKEVLLTLEAEQLDLLGQTFRPIFVGTIEDVTDGSATLNPCTIKMHNAPFFVFPTPLSFPLEKVIAFTQFDSTTVFPIT